MEHGAETKGIGNGNWEQSVKLKSGSLKRSIKSLSLYSSHTKKKKDRRQELLKSEMQEVTPFKSHGH